MNFAVICFSGEEYVKYLILSGFHFEMFVMPRENFSLCNQKLKNTFEVLNNLYLEQFSVVHSDEAFYQGTHLIPSLSEMMEWADDINIYYTTWY